MLGNSLEALIGSIYLERGYRWSRHYVIKNILMKYIDIEKLETYDDNFKSQLLEYCQKNGQSVSYDIVSKYKQDKRDRFKVAVFVDGEQIATADDFNKKSAEQSASKKALKVIGVPVTA